CPVAHLLNPEKDDGPVVVAQETEFRLNESQMSACRIKGELPALYFCPDRKGYGWAVRKGEFLNVGFGRLRVPGESLPVHLRAFRDFLGITGSLPPDLPEIWKGHAYRLYARPQRNVVTEGALLVGDSAGLAHPVSGEGILTAVESGRLAARAIIQAGGRNSSEALSAYSVSMRARYGQPEFLHAEPWYLPKSWISWLGVQLLGTRWFSRHVLLDRWFLHAGQPALE
ncbi:MAG TPA: NAD(P)/FAD-dependent oxidoreductase, partial [Verrucomicrobiales bacterium]|nr:NAD(P)/FAD-dependent oxidoreductase [Verrucomicrobiales bacterium]